MENNKVKKKKSLSLKASKHDSAEKDIVLPIWQKKLSKPWERVSLKGEEVATKEEVMLKCFTNMEVLKILSTIVQCINWTTKIISRLEMTKKRIETTSLKC